MKEVILEGTRSVPAPRVNVAERMRELLNRVLPEDCQVKKSAGMLGGLQKIAHLCNAVHLNQATDVRQLCRIGLFYGLPRKPYSTDPRVESLMASQPDSRVQQRESGTFLYPSRTFVNLLFHFKCCTKMKELALNGTTSVPAPRKSVAERTKELLNRVLPEDCQIKTASDAWNVAAVLALCATVVFPPCLPLLAWCAYKANKKGGAI